MIPLTKGEKDSHNQQKVCHICKRIFISDYKKKNTLTFKIIVIILGLSYM